MIVDWALFSHFGAAKVEHITLSKRTVCDQAKQIPITLDRRILMFKSTLAALVTLLIMSSTAFADRRPRCNPEKVPGSYVRYRTDNPYIDQLKLGSDGTAYWYQSTSFDLLFTTGTFIPEIGSWKCLEDGSVLVTTIGTNYEVSGGDMHILENQRTTQKLSVVDNDTLQPTHRIFTNTLLSADPFGPGVVQANSCTPSNPCAPFAYKRVKPKPSDIP
jgi:hypothetical protein